MSAQEVKQKAKETLKSVREMLAKSEKAVHQQLEKTTPKVVNTLDASFEKASRGMSETLSTIDRKTRKEQIELLKAYRSFLQKQVDLIDGRLKAIESEEPKRASA